MLIQRLSHTFQFLLMVFLLMNLSGANDAQNDTGTTNARWSPDGSKIATVDGQHILHIWDGTSGEQIKQFALPGKGYGYVKISWSSDGSQIAVANSTDFKVYIWDSETGSLVETLEVFPSPDEGISLAWQPNGNLLAAVAFGENESLAIWEKTTQGFQVIETEIKASLAYDLGWSLDGRELAFTDSTGINIINDFVNVPIKAERINGQTTFGFIWSPDGSKIAVLRTSVQVVDAQTGETLMTVPEEEQFIGRLSWSLDSDQITTRGEDGTYHVWDVASQKRIDSFTLDREIVPNHVAVSPYNGRFAIPPSTDDASLEIVVLFESVERVQGIARRCLADTDTLTSAVTAVLNDVVINSLTKLTLPAFVTAIKALPTGAIPVACSADLVAVAEAVIAEQ